MMSSAQMFIFRRTRPIDFITATIWELYGLVLSVACRSKVCNNFQKRGLKLFQQFADFASGDVDLACKFKLKLTTTTTARFTCTIFHAVVETPVLFIFLQHPPPRKVTDSKYLMQNQNFVNRPQTIKFNRNQQPNQIENCNTNQTGLFPTQKENQRFQKSVFCNYRCSQQVEQNTKLLVSLFCQREKAGFNNFDARDRKQLQN
eukprot:TRINITY_DN24045_c0_g2_i11.p1 TRINITY_DN24045_c0_g2~~TRINITY_DN24045_c0_g2_i11.p1  ORF type:complete len:203 (-),score=6.06 TRINITY_DN24045_c0_g2_i11:94-702(-)